MVPVAAEATTLKRSSGARLIRLVATLVHDALVPSVVRRRLALLVCEGRLTGAAAHLRPVAVEESAVRT
jgi:hypothetical protein